MTHLDNPTSTAEGQPLEPKWPSDPESRRRRVEAILFLARKPLNSRKISQLAELEDGTQANTIIRELNQKYDQAQHAFHIKSVGGGYQLRTRPQFADWIRRLEHIPGPQRLSGPALETLTVVAYRQPIIKADIEAIRGVSCGEMLRQLLERGLIKIAGRGEQLGRPFLYATSKEFLTQFGFRSLRELPRAEQLSGPGLPPWAETEENQGPVGIADSDRPLTSESPTPISNLDTSASRPLPEEEE